MLTAVWAGVPSEALCLATWLRPAVLPVRVLRLWDEVKVQSRGRGGGGDRLV